MVTVYTAYRQRSSSGRLIHSKRPSPIKKHGILSDTVFFKALLLALHQLL